MAAHRTERQHSICQAQVAEIVLFGLSIKMEFANLCANFRKSPAKHAVDVAGDKMLIIDNDVDNNFRRRAIRYIRQIGTYSHFQKKKHTTYVLSSPYTKRDILNTRKPIKR
jgi:hypothetical protein